MSLKKRCRCVVLYRGQFCVVLFTLYYKNCTRKIVLEKNKQKNCTKKNKQNNCTRKNKQKNL